MGESKMQAFGIVPLTVERLGDATKANEP